VCSGNSFHDKIYVARSVTVSRTCRKHHDQVRSDKRVPAARAAHNTGQSVVRAAQLSGSGSDGNPYIAPCPADADRFICTVEFPARMLSGFWSNESVPAYQCPADHTYLYDANYAPFGTSLPNGVKAYGLGPIGVSITGTRYDAASYAIGTRSELGFSSATNWTFGPATYTIALECTSVQSLGYFAREAVHGFGAQV